MYTFRTYFRAVHVPSGHFSRTPLADPVDWSTGTLILYKNCELTRLTCSYVHLLKHIENAMKYLKSWLAKIHQIHGQTQTEYMPTVTSICRRAVAPPPIKNGRRRRRYIFKARRTPSPPIVVGFNRLGLLCYVLMPYSNVLFAQFRKLNFNNYSLIHKSCRGLHKHLLLRPVHESLSFPPQNTISRLELPCTRLPLGLYSSYMPL